MEVVGLRVRLVFVMCARERCVLTREAEGVSDVTAYIT